MEYHIVTSSTLTAADKGINSDEPLESKVREFISDGWVPLGAPYYSEDLVMCRHIQAMIRNK